MLNLSAGKYLKYLNPLSAFNTKRTRDIFHVNPTIPPVRHEAETITMAIIFMSNKQTVLLLVSLSGIIRILPGSILMVFGKQI